MWDRREQLLPGGGELGDAVVFERREDTGEVDADRTDVVEHRFGVGGRAGDGVADDDTVVSDNL
jgi:hypothetical protein